MSKKTVSIGGATYDVFLHLDRDNFTFQAGEKIPTQKVTESCGGGASNTSVGLARLGCDATFTGIISDDQWGERLLENLRNEGVDTRSTIVVEKEVSSFSIILTSQDGERVILYDPGANEHLHDATFNKEHVCKSDWIYLNHIQESSCVIQDDIIDIVTSDCNSGLTWNPGGCQIDMGLESKNNTLLLQNTTLLLLNKEEACIFTQQNDVFDALKVLIESGAENVCITNGSKGTLASDGKNLYSCPVAKLGDVVDTTGAGDAFGCGATWALIEGKDLPTALKMGSINGASVVQYIGAQTGLLTDIDMLSIVEQVQIDVEIRPL